MFIFFREKDNIKLETKPDKVLLEASPSNYSVRVLRGNDDDAGYYTCLFSVNGKVQNKTTMLASSMLIFRFMNYFMYLSY